MQFHRNQEPKQAIGIGLFSNRDFEYLEDAKSWLMQNHVAILGLSGLCRPAPSSQQFCELRKYAADYITVSQEVFHDKSNKIVGGVVQLYKELNEVKILMSRIDAKEK